MSRTMALLAALALLAPACDSNTCNTVTTDLGEMCLPTAVAADRQVVIEVRELCGEGCSGQPSCNGFLRNGQVVLDVHHEVCQESGFYQCIAEGCTRRVVRCPLPELHEGDYTLLAPGGGMQLLRVRAGGDASCQFPSAGDGGV